MRVKDRDDTLIQPPKSSCERLIDPGLPLPSGDWQRYH